MSDGAIALSFTAPRALEDELGDVVDAFQVLGCEIRDADQGRLSGTVYVDVRHESEVPALRDVLQTAGATALKMTRIEPRDWLAPYRSAARPFPVGDTWWLDPDPEAPTPSPRRRTRLVVEPRSAFGSGSHESTQLVLLEIEAMELGGRSVLDVGTGSGVLSVAAVARGADPVAGIDIDPLSVMIAAETVRRQESPHRPLLAVGETAGVAARRFDVVLCNIVSGRLIPLLPELGRVCRPDGVLVLSGLLVIERERVRHELAANGLRPIGERMAGEWLALRVAHGR